MTTRLYCDVDGVLTATPKSWTNVSTHMVEYGGRMSVVYVDLELVHELFAQFDEIVWATTWLFVPHAHDRLVDLLEVGEYDRVALDLDEYRKLRETTGGSGKSTAVFEYSKAHPVEHELWVDDHIIDEERFDADLLGIDTIVPVYGRGGVYRCMDEVALVLEHWRG